MLALMGVIAVIVSVIMVCPPILFGLFWISVLIISDCNRLGSWCSIRPCLAGTEERQHAPKVCRAWRVITDSRPLIDTIPFVTMSYFHGTYAYIPSTNNIPPCPIPPRPDDAEFPSTDVKLQSSLSMTVVVPKKC
jgi:hypothetical protein